MLAALAWISGIVPVNTTYWYILLGGWAVLGIGYSMSITPSGRLLKRSANAEDRPALFAAQFALSHICWLITYPLVGQLGAGVSMTAAFAAMAAIALFGAILGSLFWPASDPESVVHDHPGLPPDHDHLRRHHPRVLATLM